MSGRKSGARRTSVEAREEFLKRAEELWDSFNAWHKEHPEAWYLRGEIYERLGDSSRALSAYKKVLEFRPSHLQATRKVRLANMRDRKASGSIQSDLLGRFLGKKK